MQADDFGMCHAVNEGVARAFTHGILTQASVMAPCPWFPEAAALAREHGIPVGLHGTLTCEWDGMRWRPLTRGSSLVGADGCFHRSVALASARVCADEATAELEAQVAALHAHGLAPICFDVHMGMVSRAAIERLCTRFERPFILPWVTRFLPLDSLFVLSPRPAEQKRLDLLAYLEALAPGQHLVQAHPAVASPELRALCAPGAEAEPWAEAYRTSDLALLTDPEPRRLIERRGIELVCAADLDAPPLSRPWASAGRSRGSPCAARAVEGEKRP